MQANTNTSYDPPQELTEQTLKKFCELLKRECGIYVADNKKTLVESRLLKRLRELSYSSFDLYFDRLKSEEAERKVFINLMTTNKTEFFRESYQFDYLVDRLKKLRPEEDSFWSIWSAASSSGEEAYTLAMLMDQLKNKHSGRDYKILGTDIDSDVLNTAERGLYPKEKIQEQVPSNFLPYFQEHYSGQYLVDANLQRRVKFRTFNLTRDKLPFEGFFDFIFLRNVLIYFDQETKDNVIKKLKSNLRKGGLLFLGASEALPYSFEGLKQVESSIYERTK